MKQFKRGYTQGVFDMFHVGHLNLINNAKKQCESLIVGVNADELVQSYKGKVPVITQENRREIVSNIKAVDEAVRSCLRSLLTSKQDPYKGHSNHDFTGI
ncbi:hypothetical protein EFP16_11260 [Lactiplantibacillus pentosus]|uniref:adenylyltransferase/cytidyltransferase family protein n=1 Tax=Lactiplantibacillus pentosus TaxID=1589 RepID=UPI0021A53308|nr:adenylyltransferase/cytidyltransferase family protein [Lactiplantibacillus pentosus]MCT3284079.1 hypothetical protein [Lactiplantibacillus pentosus]